MELLQDPADGQVLFTSEIDAGEEFATERAEVLRRTGFGGLGGFARFDQFVRKEDGAAIEKFAFVLLRPGLGIEHALAQRGEIDRQALRRRFVNGHAMFAEAGAILPQAMEEIPLAVRRGDDAQFFQAAAHRIGDAREDRAPDRRGILVKREFGEDDIRRIAADGLRFGRERGDTGAVRETDFGGALRGGRLRATVVRERRFETIGPFFSFFE